VRHDVHVDISGFADHRGRGSGARQQCAEPAASADSDHQLGGIDASGELDECARDLLADHLVVCPAERLYEGPLHLEGAWICFGEAIGGGDVHREKLTAGRP